MSLPDDLHADATSDAATTDADEVDSALELLRDFDADFDFFDGLFNDPTDGESINELPGPRGGATQRSDRRRQRWHEAVEVEKGATVAVLPSDDLAREWQEIARNQKRERESAEKENAALKKLLKANLQATQKILKLTRRVKTIATAVTPYENIPYLGPVMDLAHIKSELKTLAREADRVLTSGPFASSRLQFRDIHYRKCETETGDAIQIELEMAWAVPFAIDAVTTALWVHLARATPKEKLHHATDVYKDAELLVSHVVAGPKEEDGKSGVIHTQIAVRRYPPRADGSVLLVMSSHDRFIMGRSTWVGSGTGEGSLLVTSVAGHDSKTLGPLSRVSWSRRSRAQPPAESNLTAAERSQWINEAVSGPMRNSNDKVNRVIQAIENLLLTPANEDR